MSRTATMLEAASHNHMVYETCLIIWADEKTGKWVESCILDRENCGSMTGKTKR